MPTQLNNLNNITALMSSLNTQLNDFQLRLSELETRTRQPALASIAPPQQASLSPLPSNTPHSNEIGFFDPSARSPTGSTSPIFTLDNGSTIYTEVTLFTARLREEFLTGAVDVFPLLRGGALVWYLGELSSAEREPLRNGGVEDWCAILEARFGPKQSEESSTTVIVAETVVATTTEGSEKNEPEAAPSTTDSSPTDNTSTALTLRSQTTQNILQQSFQISGSFPTDAISLALNFFTMSPQQRCRSAVQIAINGIREFARLKASGAFPGPPPWGAPWMDRSAAESESAEVVEEKGGASADGGEESATGWSPWKRRGPWGKEWDEDSMPPFAKMLREKRRKWQGGWGKYAKAGE